MPARAGEIVEVLSSDALPYVQAQKGFEDGLGDRKASCRVVSLADLKNEGIEKTIGANVDCVIAIGTPAAMKLAGRIPGGVPLVFCMVAGRSAGLIAAAPATHGITMDVPLRDQFKFISEAMPAARTLGLLYGSSTPEGKRLLEQVRHSLDGNWKLEAVAVDQCASVADAINELAGRHVDVVWTSLDCGVYDAPTVHALLLTALRADLPVFGFSASFVRAGALIGINIDPVTQGNQASNMARQIIEHTFDDTRGVIQPAASFQIAVNEIVADKIGISLPQSVLDRAAYVFKEEK